tara:strand:+ start:79 stop:978 length:900 start_codon:yes stop_codon:yes gene_type:complete
MERITGKQVESIIEAYASVNGEIEEKEVISEEVAEEVVKTELVLENDEYEQIDENLLQLLTRNRTIYRRDPKTGEKIKVVQQRDPKNLDKYVDKETTNTGDFGSKGKPEPKVDPKPEPKVDPKPAANPNVTKDGTKFERRLPTMAELRAAQAARKSAPKVLSRAEIENRAVKAGVGEGQRKSPTAPPPVSATKPAAAPASTPAAKPEMTAAGNRAAELAALRAKAKADTMKKKPEMGARNRMRMEEVDVFDTIKEYLIDEGATEEEALKQMLALTDEQRTEILEGSYGSKKKKSKKGGY